MSQTPYLASDDSALLRSVIGGRSGKRCIEIGAGNAGNLVELAKSFAVAVGTDLVRPTMSDWTRTGADYVLADRGSCFKDGIFDLVVFNPPYTESDKVEDVSVDGRGNKVPLDFLREAIRVVKKSGRILFLLSSENQIEDFQRESSRNGLSFTKIAEKRLFYEELGVYELGLETGNGGSNGSPPNTD